jgi:transposase
MNKITHFIGIDISKDVFDVYSPQMGHIVFPNSQKGFKSFKKSLASNSHCLMEATGHYYYQLAVFLFENSIAVSVENPLKIKRFTQMKLSKIKTDKADAKAIYDYASSQDICLWTPPNKEALQLLSLLETYHKQSTQIKNKLHGEEALGNPSKTAVRSLKRSLKNIQKEIELIEDELEEMVKTEDADCFERVQSIPGIGRKTAVMLLITTDYMKRFESASQLCSYTGLTPIIRRSGTSIKGRERISKMGNPKLRNLLFMCSFNAVKYNKACKELFDRIVAKGKSKKLALIAVCNKLLKQAFSIIKKGVTYDDNFKSTLVAD